MSSLPESARVVLLSSIDKRSLGQRVRVVARVAGTEDRSNLIRVEDSGANAFVDVTVVLAADNAMVQLFRQPRSHIMVTGYVEELELEEKPRVDTKATALDASNSLVIRAVLVQSVPDIDMSMWRSSVSAREKLLERTYLSALPKAITANNVD
ncbi:hypothetical protein BDV93DRAFT_202535 [Ceratobasidium sp. AG-I]|nr:hypothetical protein BDV93DRAFT_202535 [Ceratobasidium sp. AG-I]